MTFALPVFVLLAGVSVFLLSVALTVWLLAKVSEDGKAEMLADELNDVCDLYEELEGNMPSDKEMETLDAIRNGSVTLVPQSLILEIHKSIKDGGIRHPASNLR